MKALKVRNINPYDQHYKTIKYILPELPDWANFSSTANCRRNTRNRYLNFRLLKNDFSFNYLESGQFQYLYNIKYKKNLEKTKLGVLPANEEDKIFFEVFDRIKNKIYPFKAPDYKRVHLVWIDQIPSMKKFKTFMNSKIMKKGHPVFVSLCLGQQEIISFINKHALKRKDIRIISFELFSPFERMLSLGNSMMFYLPSLFKKHQSLYFFIPQKKLPMEFRGKFTKIINFNK
jgi:hypothetical protein